MSNPVVHFEIISKNGDQAKDFYSKVFGWKIDSNNPMNYGLVAAGDCGIGGGIGQTDGTMPQYVTFYVQVPDVAAHLKQIESLGGKTIVPETVIPNMVTFATFQDPDGNMVGLVKG